MSKKNHDQFFIKNNIKKERKKKRKRGNVNQDKKKGMSRLRKLKK